VTIIAEEMYYRGWLLQLLQRRLPTSAAIIVQAVLFTLPQGIAALLLAPLQGVLYAVVYSWLAVGLVGGWAAARTQSIWPSLTAAVLFNFILTLVLL
jgi:membrane protease YdiL (CAAX protease family)